MGRWQTAQGYSDDVTAFHTQHTHTRLLLLNKQNRQREMWSTDAERFNRDLRLEDLIRSLNESKL